MNVKQISIIIFFLHINKQIEKIFSDCLFSPKNGRRLHLRIKNFFCIYDIWEDLTRSILILNIIIKLKVGNFYLHAFILIIINLKELHFLYVSQHKFTSLVFLISCDKGNLHYTYIDLHFYFSFNVSTFILQR